MRAVPRKGRQLAIVSTQGRGFKLFGAHLGPIDAASFGRCITWMYWLLRVGAPKRVARFKPVEKPMTDDEAPRDAIIGVLIENDGENLRSLLKALSKDHSLDAERLVELLIRHPELRDLIPESYRGRDPLRSWSKVALWPIRVNSGHAVSG